MSGSNADQLPVTNGATTLVIVGSHVLARKLSAATSAALAATCYERIMRDLDDEGQG